MLYEPAQFERLTDEPWDPGRVEDAIATIVADADAAFAPEALWPAPATSAGSSGRDVSPSTRSARPSGSALRTVARFSLWTGDVGTALFAAACLDRDARYPILDIV